MCLAKSRSIRRLKVLMRRRVPTNIQRRERRLVCAGRLIFRCHIQFRLIVICAHTRPTIYGTRCQGSSRIVASFQGNPTLDRPAASAPISGRLRRRMNNSTVTVILAGKNWIRPEIAPIKFEKVACFNASEMSICDRKAIRSNHLVRIASTIRTFVALD